MNHRPRHLYYSRPIDMTEANMLVDALNRLEADLYEAREERDTMLTDAHDCAAELRRDLAAAQAERDALSKGCVALTQSLKKANAQAEDFERKWYLRGDELEVARGEAAALLKACRKAVLALAHVARDHPVYQSDYEALSAAIDQARKESGNG